MTRSKRGRRTGSSLLEFTLVGIPMIFTLIGLFEITRGMWVYQSMAYAAREATRYATVHGSGCASPNTCQVTIGRITSVLRAAGPGFDPSTVTVTFTPASGSATTGTISALLNNTTIWPPATANATGQDVQISVKYPFKTILAIFWPGAGGPLNDSQTFNLSASSREGIQF
jgi:Flp pilus assembly protein TadG